MEESPVVSREHGTLPGNEKAWTDHAHHDLGKPVTRLSLRGLMLRARSPATNERTYGVMLMGMRIQTILE